MVDAGCLSSGSTASPTFSNFSSVNIFVLRGQSCPRNDPLGATGLRYERFLCSVAWRVAGVYGYLLPRCVPSIVKETLRRPRNDPPGSTESVRTEQ